MIDNELTQLNDESNATSKLTLSSSAITGIYIKPNSGDDYSWLAKGGSTEYTQTAVYHTVSIYLPTSMFTSYETVVVTLNGTSYTYYEGGEDNAKSWTIYKADYGDKTITVTGTLKKYTVTIKVNDSSYGSVDKTSVTDVPIGTKITSSSNTVNISGTTVTATPKSSTGQYTYSFESWTNGTALVTSDITVTANFSRSVRSYTITTSVSPKDAGTVTGGGTYEYGTTVTLNAVSSDSDVYKFSRWVYDDTGISKNNPYSFTITDTNAGEWVAEFTKITQYTVTVEAKGGCSFSKDISGSYPEGTTAVFDTSTKTLTLTKPSKLKSSATVNIKDSCHYVKNSITTPIKANTTLRVFCCPDSWLWTDSEANDEAYIKTGMPISTYITAANWNKLTTQLGYLLDYYLRDPEEIPVFTTAVAGEPITAAMFNQILEGLRIISSGVMSDVSKGDNILASYFQGSDSIKGKFNGLIENET